MWKTTGARIRRVPFVFIVAITFGFSILSGWVIYSTQISRQLEVFDQSHADKLFFASSLFNRELGELQEMTQLIHNDSRFTAALPVGQPVRKSVLRDIFKQYGSSIQNMLQIRWLNEAGMEVVRADIDNKKQVNFQPEQQLQNKSRRYYFSDAMNTDSGSVYISPVDLNIENGEYVTPLQPTIRTALKTTTQNQLQPGLLVINYNLQKLFSKLRQNSDSHTRLKVLDNNGQWLLHTDLSVEWANDLNKALPLADSAIPELWQKLQNSLSGNHKTKDGSYLSYRRINLSESSADRISTTLFLIAETDADHLSSLYWQALLSAIAATASLLLLGGLALYREYHARRCINNMSITLESENRHLLELNDELDTALHRQQKLQDDLVESRKLSALGMTVAGVAHELNTPLGGALLVTSEQITTLKALQDAVNSGLTRSALDEYLQHSHKSLEMIQSNLKSARRQLEGFKRLAYERMDDTCIEFNVHKVAEDLIHTLTPQFKNSSVTVVNEIPEHLYMYNTPGILSQVIQNLVINALKHGFSGFGSGTIRLTVGSCSAGYMQLSVSDNGRGVSPELAPRLFDPFVTSARSKSHTGLGLHLVHQWVNQQLKGTIRFEHNQPQGARFIIELPVTDREQSDTVQEQESNRMD